MSFDTSVFINCPFDARYQPLLRAIIFCVLDLRFQPRIALERLDSGETRLTKIVELIRASKFAIHDLSRLKAEKKGEFFRLNMPFELGLDVGCRIFKAGKWADKRCLILEAEKYRYLEAEKYRYQAALSDLSNSDIAVHGDDALRALREVRNWLTDAAGIDRAPGANAIWVRFNEFNAFNYDDLIGRGHSAEDVDAQTIPDLIRSIRRWCAANTV